jgi:hypothetical protein
MVSSKGTEEPSRYGRGWGNDEETRHQGSRHFSMVPIKRGARGAAHAQRDALSTILSPVLDPQLWQWPENLIKRSKEKGLRLR